MNRRWHHSGAGQQFGQRNAWANDNTTQNPDQNSGQFGQDDHTWRRNTTGEFQQSCDWQRDNTVQSELSNPLQRVSTQVKPLPSAITKSNPLQGVPTQSNPFLKVIEQSKSSLGATTHSSLSHSAQGKALQGDDSQSRGQSRTWPAGTPQQSKAWLTGTGQPPQTSNLWPGDDQQQSRKSDAWSGKPQQSGSLLPGAAQSQQYGKAQETWSEDDPQKGIYTGTWQKDSTPQGQKRDVWSRDTTPPTQLRTARPRYSTPLTQQEDPWSRDTNPLSQQSDKWEKDYNTSQVQQSNTWPKDSTSQYQQYNIGLRNNALQSKQSDEHVWLSSKTSQSQQSDLAARGDSLQSRQSASNIQPGDNTSQTQQTSVWPRDITQVQQSTAWQRENTPLSQHVWSRDGTPQYYLPPGNISETKLEKPVVIDYHHQTYTSTVSQTGYQKTDSVQGDQIYPGTSAYYHLGLAESSTAKSSITNRYDKTAEDSKFDVVGYSEGFSESSRLKSYDQGTVDTNTSQQQAGQGYTDISQSKFGRRFREHPISTSYNKVSAKSDNSLSSQYSQRYAKDTSRSRQFAENTMPSTDGGECTDNSKSVSVGQTFTNFSAMYKSDGSKLSEYSPVFTGNLYSRPFGQPARNIQESVKPTSLRYNVHDVGSSNQFQSETVTKKPEAVSIPYQSAVKTGREMVNQTSAVKESQTKTAISKSGDQNKSDSSASAAEVHCDVCDLSFPNQKAYVRHSVGIKHLGKLMEKKNEERLETPMVEMIEDSAKHAKDTVITPGTYSDDMDEKRRCEMCRVTCTSWPAWLMHQNSPQHKKNAEAQIRQDKIDEILKRSKSYMDRKSQKQSQQEQRQRDLETYKCDACNMFFNGPKTFNDHLRQLSHLSKVSEQKEGSGRRSGGILKKTNERRKESAKEESVIDTVRAVRESYQSSRKELRKEKEEMSDSCTLCAVEYDGIRGKETHINSFAHARRYKVMMDILGKKNFFKRYPDVSEGKKVALLEDHHQKTDIGGKQNSKTSRDIYNKKEEKVVESRSRQEKTNLKGETKWSNKPQVEMQKGNDYTKTGRKDMDNEQSKKRTEDNSMKLKEKICQVEKTVSAEKSKSAYSVDKASVFTQGQKLQAAWTIVDEVNASLKDKDKIRAHVLQQFREKPNLEKTELKKIALDFMKVNAMAEQKPSDKQYEYLFGCLFTGVLMDAQDKQKIKDLMKVHHDKAQNMSLESMASYAKTHTMLQRATKEKKDKIVSLLDQNLKISRYLVELKVGSDMKNEMHSFLKVNMEKGMSSYQLKTEAEKQFKGLTQIRDSKNSQNLQRIENAKIKTESEQGNHSKKSAPEVKITKPTNSTGGNKIGEIKDSEQENHSKKSAPEVKITKPANTGGNVIGEIKDSEQENHSKKSAPEVKITKPTNSTGGNKIGDIKDSEQENHSKKSASEVKITKPANTGGNIIGEIKGSPLKRKEMEEMKPFELNFDYLFACLFTDVDLDKTGKQKIMDLSRTHYSKRENMPVDSLASYMKTSAMLKKKIKEEKDLIASKFDLNLKVTKVLIELKVSIDLKDEVYNYLKDKLEKGVTLTQLKLQAQEHFPDSISGKKKGTGQSEKGRDESRSLMKEKEPIKQLFSEGNKAVQQPPANGNEPVKQPPANGNEPVKQPPVKSKETIEQVAVGEKGKAQLSRNDAKENSSKPTLGNHAKLKHHPSSYPDTSKPKPGSSVVQNEDFKYPSEERSEEVRRPCTTSLMSESELIQFVQGVVHKMPVKADEKDLIYQRVMSQVHIKADIPLEDIGHLALRFMESLIHEHDEGQSSHMAADKKRKRPYQDQAGLEEYQIKEKRIALENVSGEILDSENEMIRRIMLMSKIDEPEIAREALAIASSTSGKSVMSLEERSTTDTDLRPPLEDTDLRRSSENFVRQIDGDMGSCEDDEITSLMENFVSNKDIICQIQMNCGFDDPSFIKNTIEKCFKNPRIRQMLKNPEDLGGNFAEIMLQELLNLESAADTDLRQADSRNEQVMSGDVDLRIQEYSVSGDELMSRSWNRVDRGRCRENQHDQDVDMRPQKMRNEIESYGNTRDRDYRR